MEVNVWQFTRETTINDVSLELNEEEACALHLDMDKFFSRIDYEYPMLYALLEALREKL